MKFELVLFEDIEVDLRKLVFMKEPKCGDCEEGCTGGGSCGGCKNVGCCGGD